MPQTQPKTQPKTIEDYIRERAGLELDRVEQREKMKDRHRADLKEFDRETNRLLTQQRQAYQRSLKESQNGKDAQDEKQ